DPTTPDPTTPDPTTPDPTTPDPTTPDPTTPDPTTPDPTTPPPSDPGDGSSQPPPDNPPGDQPSDPSTPPNSDDPLIDPDRLISDGLEPLQPDSETDNSSLALIINPNLTDPELQPDIRLDPVNDLEGEITNDYSRHFGTEFGIPPIGVIEAQNQLQQVQTATGIQPALIYALFLPALTEAQTTDSSTSDIPSMAPDFAYHGPQGTDELELMLVTTNGDPIRIHFPDVTRDKVERMVRQFQSDITSPVHRNGDRYLSSARTLYQWLVAPLEADLAAAGIENLTFILDSGLRSLPIAALHDGEQFLIERYSVGIMPSLSLTDTRYVDSRDLGILAMGASEFDHQAPLPAVPLELQIIAEEVWQNGAYFLNDQFTMDNLKFQRQQRPYGIVHLATHGEFQAGSPENSYLQLGDRQLRLNELRELGLHNPPVELLVLSACRTALGDEDAELGFAGLALQAGVKSVMASLWYVSDAGALGLTTEFYRQLRQTPIKAEALRQAQLAMIRGEVAVEGNMLRNARGATIFLPENSNTGGTFSVDMSHPFYWSAFTMIGNPW
ncbi:MAG: CHAT domain-containing protein, partial [Leptolyngbyaceae bacterium]|nr:CHAT domain-containing protein [Leptolyngbyaceae bacterium]